ncbi:MULTISPECIES: AzlC family ABC transporter permease [unclassified Caulobacter]|uniref:AzlC family ABC transporter permease n=1 Tax=unclassified Caulobacter TaxID=2648921 RepID=UPI0018EEB5D5|nr:MULTISPECIES: AzlC family ABC transporter permease [unclassified Caulobacter]
MTIETCAPAAMPGDGPSELRSESRVEFWRGLVASLPVTAGFTPFALVLGAQAAQKGLSVAETPLMTGLNFAGGSEFAAIGLWTSPPHLLLITAVTLMINSRHLLMGAALTPFLKGLPKRRVLPALFLMCDESWAMALADAKARGTFSLAHYLGVALPMWLAWIAFTALGAMVGPVLGNVETLGFDMAFPAIFLVLLRGMWKSFSAARPWLVSLTVAACGHLLAPGAWTVAAGALAGLLSAWLWAGGEQPEEEGAAA